MLVKGVGSPGLQKWSKCIFKVQLKCQQHFFADPNASANKISIFHNPFNCVIEELPPNLPLEDIDPQCDSMLKYTYKEKN